jgi:rhodanese-related sulfurtransferase
MNFHFRFRPVIFQIITGNVSAASTSVLDLVKQAKQEIENLSPLQAKEELTNGTATFIDIREAEELLNGKIEGAVHAPRGMLEFYADPALPYYKPAFDKEKRLILYCASGGRSALAVQSLKKMGYKNIAHIDGGIKAWKEAGFNSI